MKLGTRLHYSVEDWKPAIDRIVELERRGVDRVWVSEAYGYDAVSLVGYLAARTERVEIGTGILNVYSRTPAAIAQTAAGCDRLSDGRFILGLGASGPQVIEGFHGVAYEKPLSRISDYIDIVRMALRKERLVHDGRVMQVPLPPGQGTGLGKPLKLIGSPVRTEIPIWWASLMAKSVAQTARIADGWLPTLVVPERLDEVWGDALATGFADRPDELGPLEIQMSPTVAIGDQYAGGESDRVLTAARQHVALYWGGMGAREKNFYNTIAREQGFEEEAIRVQDLYLEGHKADAAAAVPEEFLVNAHLVGPAGFVAERLAAMREAGVTSLNVTMAGDDPLAEFDQLRDLVG
ncbi:MAG: LLM class F420-dependent oxidoreductase [Actinomycetota bacterium]